MSELHPIFDKILDDFIKPIPKQESVRAVYTESVLDLLTQDISFDTLETLRGLINEVKEHPNDVIIAITREADKLEEKLVEKSICPLCGAELEFEHDSSQDTYVPYGSTSVVAFEGGCLVCESCGYRSE